jgi:hypothetical protein
VWKHELLLTTNGADGTLRRPWQSDYKPTPEYVTSVAVMF